MATSSLRIEIPSPKLTPKPEPVDEELSDMQLDNSDRRRSSTATPVDEAYYAATSESPLFDALPSAGLTYSQEYDDATSESVIIGLREKGVVVSAPRCHDAHRSPIFDEKRFEYSCGGKYEFDEDKYDVVFIKMPSSKDPVVDTYQISNGRDERWHDVLLGGPCLQAHAQKPSLRHVRSAKNPLECYAALRVGAPSPLPASLEETFKSIGERHIQILSSSFFSRNPRFIEMVSARYNELKEFCDKTLLDAPKEITSLYSGAAAIVLLRSALEVDGIWDVGREAVVHGIKVQQTPRRNSGR
ncbi:predicted protein [Sclerotinia sclerotiorum 1980 UF-70]|uniref:Uncharacterized protein n=1 Tax=Sclerotinia sclerotiorum (strain ATCC 18683 / 1980 / Ss-1) TaxID=665079 RepID=A7F3B2_SCLS1|nr:predicted protein [Sclerotinia sclerotiorum 1980 UF-70]EDN97233.1 predicted protein [Sclerotinia sclerotiorum 1980 UF-70]